MKIPSGLEKLATTAVLIFPISMSNTGCKKATEEIAQDTSGQVKSAINPFSSAEEFEQRKDWESAAWAYRQAGNEAKAKECYEKAARQSEEHKNWASAAWAYRNAGNEAKAIECFEKEARQSEEQKNWWSAALAYRNAGNEAKTIECERKMRENK